MSYTGRLTKLSTHGYTILRQIENGHNQMYNNTQMD